MQAEDETALAKTNDVRFEDHGLAIDASLIKAMVCEEMSSAFPPVPESKSIQVLSSLHLIFRLE